MGRKAIEMGACGEASLAEMAAPAEHRTSQRTQTSRHPGQPIAMSEKSSNFALAIQNSPRGNQGIRQQFEIFGDLAMRRH